MRLIFQKIIVFLLTFLAYAGLHALREGWALTKTELSDEFSIDMKYLGLVDTLYLIFYSLGMAVLSQFIAKVPLKWYIIGGLLMSAFFYCSFALFYDIFGKFSIVFMTIAMCINGFFQATGWPGIMAVFGNWFQKQKKGVLMAIWAMNANTGNIIAEFMCNLLQKSDASWTLNFISTAVFAGFVAVLMILFLKSKPYEEQIKQISNAEPNSLVQQNSISKEEEEKNDPLTESLLTDPWNQKEEKPKQEKKVITVFQALFLPRVPFYMIGYACLKGCIYGLLFWLPTYLDQKGLGEQKGFISSMVDFGALFGGTLVGFLADRFNKRALFLSPLLFLSSVTMFIVAFALGSDAWQYFLGMFLVGTMIGGPYNIIGTVIAIDLGQQTGSSTNITSVSSLIEGSAAIFAALSQAVIPYIPFDFIFYLFAGECLAATIVLMPLFLSQFRSIRNQRK